MNVSTDEAKRARAKAKRAAVKAARKERQAKARARDARIEQNHVQHILSDVIGNWDGIDDQTREYLKLPKEDRPWEWDTRVKPPEAGK